MFAAADGVAALALGRPCSVSAGHLLGEGIQLIFLMGTTGGFGNWTPVEEPQPQGPGLWLPWPLPLQFPLLSPEPECLEHPEPEPAFGEPRKTGGTNMMGQIEQPAS